MLSHVVPKPGLNVTIKVTIQLSIETTWDTMTTIDTRDEDLRLLRIEQVLELVPFARSSLYRAIKAGEFPAPIKFGGVSLWSNQEIRAWKGRLMASRFDRDNDDLV